MHNLEFKLQPSRRYFIFFFLFFGVTLGIFMFLPLQLALKIPGVLLLLAYGGYIFHHQVILRSRQSIQSIQVTNEGLWRVCTQSGVIAAELMGDSVVTPVASILRFRLPGKFFKATCLIFPDSLPMDGYRKLCVICHLC